MAMGPVGVVVLLLVRNCVWLAKRCDKSRPYCGLWAAPGGSIDEGEEHLAAAIREVKEETGLVLDANRLNYGSRTEHKYDNGAPFSMHWYYARLHTDEEPQMMEPHKQGAWVPWIIQPSLQDMVTPGTWEALQARDLKREVES